MIHIQQPATVSGTLTAPPSKSSMQRACAAALLHPGITRLIHPGISNDDKAALDVIRALGARVQELSDGTLEIQGGAFPNLPLQIHCGESGLGLRMFAPIAALQSHPVTITGSGSLLNRPMDFFDDIFPQLNIQIKSKGGKLPIELTGPLQPKEITIDGSLSSQFLTGLLFAFAFAANDRVCIHVNHLKSTPYIDLTLDVLHHFGYQVQHETYTRFIIDPRKQVSRELDYRVEGDWSGASFLLVAGAVAGAIRVEGLSAFSSQADKAILQALMQSGALVSVTESAVEVAAPSGKQSLQAFQFDATHCPDLFPPLVALATFCEGTSVIQGVTRLTHKESNRGLTLQEEFGKLGIRITLQDDLMLVEGGRPKGATVHSRHDHRIAMALAVAALNSDGAVHIEEAEAIGKSYPEFYHDLSRVTENSTSGNS